jgi:Cu-Zn family superoxide dismutase
MSRVPAAVLALIVLSFPAFAQEARKHALVDTATIVRVDPDAKALTVRDEGGAETRIALDESTRVQRGAQTIPPTQLEPGDRVAISARREGAVASEQPVADLVQVVVEPEGEPGMTPPVGTSGPLGASEMRVAMRGPQGEDHGELGVRDTHVGLLLRLALRGLPPGPHAFHVHAVGRCEPPFDSAGDHYAPQGRQHGFLAPGGPHAGDLVNVHVGADGSVEQEMLEPDLRVADLLEQDGAAFIVHERADDFASQPSGNAGARIACGAIQRGQGEQGTGGAAPDAS